MSSLLLLCLPSLNFRSRTARTSRPSPTSNPENNIPFDLLHGLQYQQLWLGQRPLHNINGLAHNPNIANSSSLHRKCARTLISAARHLTSRTMRVDYMHFNHGSAYFLDDPLPQAYQLSVMIRRRIECR